MAVPDKGVNGFSVRESLIIINLARPHPFFEGKALGTRLDNNGSFFGSFFLGNRK